MTSAIHNRQAGAGKVIMSIAHSDLVNTAGTRVCPARQKGQSLSRRCQMMGGVLGLSSSWETADLHLLLLLTYGRKRNCLMSETAKYDRK